MEFGGLRIRARVIADATDAKVTPGPEREYQVFTLEVRRAYPFEAGREKPSREEVNERARCNCRKT
jgi:hypothetical protein